MLTIDDMHCKDHWIEAQNLYDNGQLSDEEIVELSEEGIIKVEEDDLREAEARLKLKQD